MEVGNKRPLQEIVAEMLGGSKLQEDNVVGRTDTTIKVDKKDNDIDREVIDTANIIKSAPTREDPNKKKEEIENEDVDGIADGILVVTDPEITSDEFEEVADELQGIVDNADVGEVPFTDKYEGDYILSCPICGGTFVNDTLLESGEDTCPICCKVPDAFVVNGKIESAESAVEKDELQDNIEHDDNLEEPEDLEQGGNVEGTPEVPDDKEEDSIRKESKEVKGNKLQESEKIQEGEYEDYMENEKALAEDYKSRVLNNITPDIRNSFNDLKDIMDTDTRKTLVDGFYLPEKAVAILEMADKSHHLNSYMNLTISDILNMVDDNDTIEGAINELFEEYKADSAYSWASNFIEVLSKLNLKSLEESCDTKLDESITPEEDTGDYNYFYSPKQIIEICKDRKYRYAFDEESDSIEELEKELQKVKRIESEKPIMAIKQPIEDTYPGWEGCKVKTILKDGREFISEEDILSVWAAVQLVVADEVIKESRKPLSEESEKEETLEDVINRAHEEELGAIDTYDTVLSKTDENTDTKLVDMIEEIKKDEQDHELLLKHYIETGEALTDDELESLKNGDNEETSNELEESKSKKLTEGNIWADSSNTLSDLIDRACNELEGDELQEFLQGIIGQVKEAAEEKDLYVESNKIVESRDRVAENLPKFIYDLTKSDFDVYGETAWSANEPEIISGMKVYEVSKNGKSEFTMKDIEEAVLKEFPELRVHGHSTVSVLFEKDKTKKKQEYIDRGFSGDPFDKHDFEDLVGLEEYIKDHGYELLNDEHIEPTATTVEVFDPAGNDGEVYVYDIEENANGVKIKMNSKESFNMNESKKVTENCDKLNGTEESAVELAIDMYKKEPRDIEEIVSEAIAVYNNGNVEPEYEDEEFYGEEADYDKVLSCVKQRLELDENKEAEQKLTESEVVWSSEPNNVTDIDDPGFRDWLEANGYDANLEGEDEETQLEILGDYLEMYNEDDNELVAEDWNENIIPKIENQLDTDDLIILQGTAQTWRGQWEACKILKGIDEFENLVADYDIIRLEKDDADNLSIDLVHHDGTHSMALYTFNGDVEGVYNKLIELNIDGFSNGEYEDFDDAYSYYDAVDFLDCLADGHQDEMRKFLIPIKW